MTVWQCDELFQRLAVEGHAAWAEQLRRECLEKFSTQRHGTLAQWIHARDALPHTSNCRLNANQDCVEITGMQVDHETLRKTLMQFHPWRKGPFCFFGLEIDTEWRSDWKWKRIAGRVDFHGKSVLDVGCGNGYYGWRMVAAGAEWVFGCDPFLLYVMQFEAVRKYANRPERHFVVPMGVEDLPRKLNLFDLTFSMGVLYHRADPIGHLQMLAGCLKSGGQVVVETIVLPDADESVLVPRGRYAKMRNVWFIPSVPMLKRWLARTGFGDIQVVDMSVTTFDEQRSTPWMTFESLSNFLDPDDLNRTIEGYPAPRRAVLLATKKS